MALTTEEQNHVISQWKSLIPDKNAKVSLGVVIFITLFETYPEYRKLFKAFRDVATLDELKTMPQLRAHGLRVVNSFDGCVECIDDILGLTHLLDGLAQGHKERNVTRVHFENTMGLIKKLILDALGDKADKVAWDKFFATAESEILKAYV